MGGVREGQTAITKIELTDLFEMVRDTKGVSCEASRGLRSLYLTVCHVNEART